MSGDKLSLLAILKKVCYKNDRVTIITVYIFCNKPYFDTVPHRGRCGLKSNT